MTREQDLERRLADWLTDGPATAPPAVVDEAIERTFGRRQRHPLWGRLREPLDRVRARDEIRLAVPVLMLALTLVAALAIAVPFAGATRPAPEMDDTSVLQITGTAEVTDESRVDGVTERVVDVESADPRVRGEAQQVLRIEVAPGAGLQRSTGVMRLQNGWGAWEGVVHGVRYPDGSELEYGWLEGQDAYEGFSYFHSTKGSAAETERTVEGAIWPDEPPSMPDPSLLP
jgi:hypothetical protein